MKGLWTSDWIWFKSQKRFLLMMAFLIVCFLFSGQSSFLILYFPLFLTILSTRRVLEGVSGKSARFLFTLPFSRKDYLIREVSVCAGLLGHDHGGVLWHCLSSAGSVDERTASSRLACLRHLPSACRDSDSFLYPV